MKTRNKTMVWQMSAESACVFFEACHVYNLNTESERLALLDYMKSQGYMDRVYTTERDKDTVINDLSKHFKVVRAKVK